MFISRMTPMSMYTPANRFGTQSKIAGGGGGDKVKTGLDVYTEQLRERLSEARTNNAINQAADENAERLAKQFGDASDEDIDAHGKRLFGR
ncbi:MAG: hypothetical protein ACKO37_06965 [Vampirovibrionales bacterium]